MGSSAGNPGRNPAECPSVSNQMRETPNVDLTKLLSNTAIVAAIVGALAAVYTLATGKHLTPDQQAALTQLVPALGMLVLAFGVKRAKAAAYRSTANVADVVAGHLEKVGEVKAADAVLKAVGKL